LYKYIEQGSYGGCLASERIICMEYYAKSKKVQFTSERINEIKKNIERQLTYIGIGQVHRMGHNFYLSGEIQNYTLGWYSYKACLPSMKVTNREKED